MYGNALTRFTPRNVVPFEAFNRAIEEFFGDLNRNQEGVARSWAPAVDIVETPEHYEVRAELPGVKKEDVDISVENNVLTLRGERKFEKDEPKESFHRIERAYGSFVRSFTLPTRVNPEQVQAKFDTGVLTILIPKAAEARPRRIEIA
jgi:HSP20 family protein